MSKSFPGLFANLFIPLTMMGSTIWAQQPAGQAIPSRIGRIYIVGNANVPERTIMKLFALYPGQQYLAADLRTAEKNLARSKLFTGVKISALNPNDKYHDIRIDVTESPLGKAMGLPVKYTEASIRVLLEAMGIGFFR